MMILHKSATMLFRLESLIIISLLLLMPLAGQAQDLLSFTSSEKTISPQRAPVKKSAPAKIRPMVKPQQARAAGHQQPVCEGEPLPDIETKDLRIEGSGKHGESHKITVEIVNSGQCASGAFSIKATMRIQAQGIDKVVQLGTKGAPSLKPCKNESCDEASYSLVFTFIPQYNHAFYDVTVDVDAGNNVSEFRENNNRIRGDLRIQIY
jgi:hypothetical protein